MDPTTESRLRHALEDTHNVTAYHALVTGHAGMVHDMARRLTHRGRNGDVSDLLGEGHLALCEAAWAVADERPGCRFSTYAHYKIKARMVTHLRRADGQSEWQARLYQEARRSWDSLTQELGRFPTYDEHAFVESPKLASVMAAPHETTPLEDASEAELATEDKAEFAYERVPLAARKILGRLSDGATLGQVAQEWDHPRDQLHAQLERARDLLDD